MYSKKTFNPEVIDIQKALGNFATEMPECTAGIPTIDLVAKLENTFGAAVEGKAVHLLLEPEGSSECRRPSHLLVDGLIVDYVEDEQPFVSYRDTDLKLKSEVGELLQKGGFRFATLRETLMFHIRYVGPLRRGWIDQGLQRELFCHHFRSANPSLITKVNDWTVEPKVIPEVITGLCPVPGELANTIINVHELGSDSVRYCRFPTVVVPV